MFAMPRRNFTNQSKITLLEGKYSAILHPPLMTSSAAPARLSLLADTMALAMPTSRTSLAFARPAPITIFQARPPLSKSWWRATRAQTESGRAEVGRHHPDPVDQLRIYVDHWARVSVIRRRPFAYPPCLQARFPFYRQRLSKRCEPTFGYCLSAMPLFWKKGRKRLVFFCPAPPDPRPRGSWRPSRCHVVSARL